MNALGTAQLFSLAALMFFSMGSLAICVLTRPLLRWTERWAPADRHRALAVFALTPPLVAGVALVSVTLPSLLGVAWPALDHCLSHGGSSHLCFVHGSHHVGHPEGWVVLAIAAVCCAFWLARGGNELWRAASAIQGLISSARPDPRRGYWVVSSSLPLCASVGLFRPRLVISDGLLAQLSEREIDVIVAHENEHERRMDTLVRLTARMSTAFVVPDTRRSLRAALEAAAEQACDEEAVASTGDRLGVADAILTVERKLDAALRLSHNPLAIGFGGSSVAARVHALLEPARESGSVKMLFASLMMVMVALLGGFEHLHHLTESLLGHLGH
jgi:Zn-dependent protease with chaperone function